MFDDILKQKEKKADIEEPTKEEIIEAMKHNIKQKQKMIDQLLRKVDDLERQVEAIQTHTGI